MNATQCLESFIAVTEKTDLPKGLKVRVTTNLRYFLSQSLCSSDRRHSQAELTRNWRNFEALIKSTNLPTLFHSNVDGWRRVEELVGVRAVELPPKAKKKFDGKDTDQLLEHLIRQISQKPSLSETEKKLIQVGLFYLHAESVRGRGQRNNARIQWTWSTIQPFLRKLRLLDEFDLEPEAKKRLKAFITDKFL